MPTPSTVRLDAADGRAELFVEPSREAKFLLRYVPWLVAPREGTLGRVPQALLVAPFTQLTVVSFDLQFYLFQIFHQRLVAQAGHFTFIPAVNFFLMAALARFAPESGAFPLPVNGALAWAGVLALLALGPAISTRLVGWYLVTLSAIAALYLGATSFAAATAGVEAANPWLWMIVSATCIAFSHAPEPRMPPRAISGNEWVGYFEYVRGPKDRRHGAGTTLRRGLRATSFTFWGTLNELWAAPRLLPYNFLLLMMRLGYAPALYAELKDRERRALASGNPAIDYVGIGGGTRMVLER